MTNIIFGKDVSKIERLLSKEMPALDFLIWDLAPFLPHMHNWRKNMIFIECEEAAIMPLAELLAGEFKTYDIRVGIKKPVMKFERSEKDSTIIITSREAKSKTKNGGRYPKLEKCLVDLLFYSKNDILPLDMNDILDLWVSYFESKKEIHFNELYRYSMRRYLGWFVGIFAYEMSNKMELGADKRHIASGRKNLELIQKVESLG